MKSAGYPARTLIGLSLVAALSLYAAVDFYGEQIERNKAARDSYQIANQEKRFEPVKNVSAKTEVASPRRSLVPIYP